MDDLPGDVCSTIAYQEIHDACYLFRLAHSSHGDTLSTLRLVSGPLFIAHSLSNQRSFDRARPHTVAADVVGSKLQRERFGEGVLKLSYVIFKFCSLFVSTWWGGVQRYNACFAR